MTEEQFKKEVDFVENVITHYAGYDLDLFGYLCIRPTDQGIWCVDVGNEEIVFSSPKEAAVFFVQTRLKLNLGLDLEVNHLK